jgi:hypothetical protein
VATCVSCSSVGCIEAECGHFEVALTCTQAASVPSHGGVKAVGSRTRRENVDTWSRWHVRARLAFVPEAPPGAEGRVAPVATSALRVALDGVATMESVLLVARFGNGSFGDGARCR